VDDRGNQFLQHIPRLRRYARALTGDRSRADDLVQDTLERALVKLHLWHPGSDLRAWLFTIMHNVHINQLRAHAGAVSASLDDEAMQLAAQPVQPDMLELRDLQGMLLRLPDEQREVLLMVGLEQLTYGETAAALGIPIGTVMSRLSRARERLRSLLAGAQVQAGLKVVK
jgi:RNA polymerase sigma-70 factor (ECF subfamily)